jgi:glucan biosynthesis protein C
MIEITDQKPERQYYIDWLRILLIISVFLFHVGMIFNNWPWHIKNGKQYGGMLTQIMNFLHCWRMPLLFLISGAGTYFALGKRTSGEYLSERFKRLAIPLVIGIFSLVPVQVYMEKSAEYNSLLDFYPHMFEGVYPEGNFSWHHLWFIAYLFLISLFISPFLNFLRGRRFINFRLRIERFVTKPLALNIFIIPLLLSQIILQPFFNFGTNDLIHDWSSITFYILFFLAGFLLLPSKEITNAISKYRFWYLAETFVATFVMFRVPYLLESEMTGEIVFKFSSIFLAWSCAITAIGFAKRHLNTNSDLRRVANEAIYPFYLLHQPVLVVIGYFITRMDIAVSLKAVIITAFSFVLIVTVYWFLIRPFNPLRIIFGMKDLKIRKKEPVTNICMEQAIAEANRTLPQNKTKVS